MIVADASIVIKWISPLEQNHEKAMFLYQKHLKIEEEILVPELLFIEVANYLATKTATNEKDIEEGLRFLYQSNLTTHVTQIIICHSPGQGNPEDTITFPCKREAEK